MLDDQDRAGRRFSWTSDDLPDTGYLENYMFTDYTEDRFVSDMLYASDLSRADHRVRCFCGEDVLIRDSQRQSVCICGAKIQKALMAARDRVGFHVSAVVGGLLMVDTNPSYGVSSNGE